MAGVKTTISYIHIGVIVSPTVTCRVSMLLKSLGTLKGRNSCQHICPSEASKVKYRVIRLFLNGLK